LLVQRHKTLRIRLFSVRAESECGLFSVRAESECVCATSSRSSPRFVSSNSLSMSRSRDAALPQPPLDSPYSATSPPCAGSGGNTSRASNRCWTIPSAGQIIGTAPGCPRAAPALTRTAGAGPRRVPFRWGSASRPGDDAGGRRHPDLARAVLAAAVHLQRQAAEATVAPLRSHRRCP
jgi:hypothetical protein